MNTSTDNSTDPCFDSIVGNTTAGFQGYALFYAVLNFLLMFVSLWLWYIYRDLEPLKKRSFLNTLLIPLSWTCQIFAGSVKRATSASPSFFNGCFLVNFTFLSAVPCLLVAILIRVILVRRKIAYNYKLSEDFKAEKPYSSHVGLRISSNPQRGSQFTEAATANGELKRLRFYASTKFGRILAVLGLIPSVLVSFLYAILNCSDFGIADECSIVRFSDPANLIMSVFPPALLCMAVIYYLRKLRKYPDPFRIIQEIRFYAFFHTPLSFLFFTLSMFDVGNFSTPPIAFTFSLLYDLTLLIGFLYAIPYQVYLAKRVLVMKTDDSMELKEVLEHPIGKELFRQHLVNEFSIENLNFYQAVKKYKQIFSSHSVMSTNKLARNLYSKYISASSPEQINLSHEVAMKLHAAREVDRQYSVNIFDEAQANIYKLMKNDSFYRFKLTQDYKSFMKLDDIMAISKRDL